MTKSKFAGLASLTVVLALACAWVAAPHVLGMVRPAGEVFPMWAVSYTDLDEMASGVDAVVLATVEDTAPGRVAYGSGDSVPVPFTLVGMRVDEVLRGGGVSDRLVLERTGGEYEQHMFTLDGDGGPYAVGDQVLLFLNRQEGTSYWYLVNPQGRFDVVGGTLDAAAPDDPVAMQLDTLTLTQARDRLTRTH